MEFVKFKEGEQRKFMLKVKMNSGLTWQKFAESIGKSTPLMFFYLREDCKIPQKIVDSLSQRYNFVPRGIKIIKLKNSPAEFKFPNFSKEFSEFLGILAGDGCLTKDPARIDITSHRILDKSHIDRAATLFERLFKQKPKFSKQRNVIRLYFYSKELTIKLNQRYGFPIGKKKGSLHVPEVIRNNKEYTIAFLRGLFDTDGCISRHHKNSGAIVEISSLDKSFLKEINELLLQLGFNTSVGSKNVKIYSRDQITKFFDLVKPANEKHTIKYKSFKTTGQVPLTKDLLRRWSNG